MKKGIQKQAFGEIVWKSKYFSREGWKIW